MTKTIKIFLILCLLTWNSDSQSQILNPEDFKVIMIDSCLSWMRINTYTGQDLDNFHAIAIQTLKRSLKSETSQTIAEVHEELANWHGYNGTFSPDSVVYHSEKALNYYKKGDNKKKIADTYRTLSIDYLNVRKLEKAQEVLFKSITLYEELDDKAGLGGAYRSLGVLYRVMEDYEKSIEYTLKAIPLLEASEKYATVAVAQFNLIIGYGKLGEFEKAYKATDYCLEIVRTKAPEEKFVPVRAHSYRGEVYMKANDFDNALNDYMQAWELCKAIVGEERCATYRTEIGHLYLLRNDYDKALMHLSGGVKAYDDYGQSSMILPYLDVSESYVRGGECEYGMRVGDQGAA